MSPTDALLRVRTGARAVLALALAASVIANVLHAQPTLVGRAIAAWPPVALMLTIELIIRVPVHSRRLSGLRIAATAGIASIAGWASYWHMVAVAQAHGESADTAHLVPLTVDGLIVVASVCLVEIAARLRSLVESPDRIESPQATEPTESPDRVESPSVARSPAAPVAYDPTESPEATGSVVQLRSRTRPAARTEGATAPKIDKLAGYVERIKEAAQAGKIDYPIRTSQVMSTLSIGASYARPAVRQIKDEGWNPSGSSKGQAEAAQ